MEKKIALKSFKHVQGLSLNWHLKRQTVRSRQKVNGQETNSRSLLYQATLFTLFIFKLFFFLSTTFYRLPLACLLFVPQGSVLRSLSRGASSFANLLKVCLFQLGPVLIQVLVVCIYLLIRYNWSVARDVARLFVLGKESGHKAESELPLREGSGTLSWVLYKSFLSPPPPLSLRFSNFANLKSCS